MIIKYQKSSIYEEYYVLTFIQTIKCGDEPPIEEEVILDFNYVLWNFGLYRSDFVEKMIPFNGLLHEGLIYINYLLFPTEEDVKNAIDYLNSLIIMDKLNNE